MRIYNGYRNSRRRRRAWAADNPGNREIRDELLAAVVDNLAPELRREGRVLDIGCGTGFWLRALVTSGIDPNRLIGVDLLPERLAAAADSVPDVAFRHADVTALPFEDGAFEIVLLFTVLSSLADADEVINALREAKRVLHNAGALLIYEARLPNPLNPNVRLIRDQELDRGGIQPRREQRLTLLPPLARRLGKTTPWLYPRLARLSPLVSHRLVVHRPEA